MIITFKKRCVLIIYVIVLRNIFNKTYKGENRSKYTCEIYITNWSYSKKVGFFSAIYQRMRLKGTYWARPHWWWKRPCNFSPPICCLRGWGITWGWKFWCCVSWREGPRPSPWQPYNIWRKTTEITTSTATATTAVERGRIQQRKWRQVHIVPPC